MRYLRNSLLFLALSFPACRKGDSGPNTGTSPLLFVNTSVRQPSVDIYSNGALLYSNLSFPDSTGYLHTKTSVNRLTILNAGDTLASQPTHFSSGQEYSVFVLDTGISADVLVSVIPDSIPAVRPGYALLRFLNFSTSVSNLDLYSSTLGYDLFTDRYFDETDAFACAFVPYPSGTYDLELRAPGTFVSVASLNGVVLADGKAYTFFAKGITGVADDRSLGIGVLRHN